MRFLFPILIFIASISSCATSNIAVPDKKEAFKIKIVFRTEEAEKRIPYKLQAIELSLKNTLPDEPRGYMATIKVLPNTLNKVLEKMNIDSDIVRVELQED